MASVWRMKRRIMGRGGGERRGHAGPGRSEDPASRIAAGHAEASATGWGRLEVDPGQSRPPGPRTRGGAMLVLTFRVAEAPFAVAVARVVEVVPRVALRAMPHSPDYLAGLLHYRGKAVPVVDLGARI